LKHCSFLRSLQYGFGPSGSGSIFLNASFGCRRPKADPAAAHAVTGSALSGLLPQGAMRSMPLALISGVVSGAISSRMRDLAPSASFAPEATPAVYTV
jgi:hypothetical protein